MIENKKQLEVSELWLGRFKQSLDDVEQQTDLPEVLKELVIASYWSMIDELSVDIEVFKKNNP